MLWWSDFILMISLKFFAGICNPLPNLNFFRVKFFVMNSASGADDRQVKTNKFSSNFWVQIENEFALPSKIFEENEGNNM